MAFSPPETSDLPEFVQFDGEVEAQYFHKSYSNAIVNFEKNNNMKEKKGKIQTPVSLMVYLVSTI